MIEPASTVEVSTDVAAPAEAVWALVADLPRMGEWSPENEGAEWLHGANGPAVGATFTGSNRRGSRKWTTKGRITESTPGRALAFEVTAGPFKVASWRYDLEPTASGCVVTESWVDQRGGVVKVLGRLTTGVPDRASHNKATMTETLSNLKAAAEAGTTGH